MCQGGRVVFGYFLRGKESILRCDGLLAGDFQPALRSDMASRLLLRRMRCERSGGVRGRLLVELRQRLGRGFGHILAAIQTGRRNDGVLLPRLGRSCVSCMRQVAEGTVCSYARHDPVRDFQPEGTKERASRRRAVRLRVGCWPCQERAMREYTTI
jgi:hypothetical protein